jgi:hypothetical protein
MKSAGTTGLVAAAALGLAAAALTVPTLASGNARTTVGTGAAAAAIAKPFVAQLNGANEVPTAGDPDGTGSAAVTIDPTAADVCFDLRAEGIATATLAHIHEGAAGVAGPVVVNFTPPTPTSSGCVSVDPTLAAAIVANPAGYYVNVHNADFTAGAVRGQLAASATTSGDVRMLDEPLRAYDSRNVAAGAIGIGETRVISLATGLDSGGVARIAVPPGATSAVVKLTVTDTQGQGGFLKMYSNALTTPPPTASVNWSGPNQIIGETGPVAVDAEGKIKITDGVNATHFVIDVVGFIF